MTSIMEKLDNKLKRCHVIYGQTHINKPNNDLKFDRRDVIYNFDKYKLAALVAVRL